MRLEKKRQAEFEKRKGTAKRTLAMGIWLVVSFVVAYLVSSWLITSNTISVDFFYDNLSIPESVSAGTITIALTIVLVILLQFLIYVGYAFASPEARKRTGQPTVDSKDPDPYDNKFDYR